MPLQEHKKRSQNVTEEKKARRRKRHKRKQEKSSEELYEVAAANLAVVMTREKKTEVEPKVAVPVAVIQYFLHHAQVMLEEKQNLTNSENITNKELNEQSANAHNKANSNTSQEVEAVLFGNTARLYTSSALNSTSSLTSEENTMSGIKSSQITEKEELVSRSANTTELTNSHTTSAYLYVEVETTQGYVYIGELIQIDAYYNLTLQNAHIRRERLCDVERFLLHQRYTSLYAPLNTILGKQSSSQLLSSSLLSGANDLMLNSYAERTNSATRPTYVGSVVIRSSNLYMIRFLSEQSNVHDHTTNNNNVNGIENSDNKSIITLSSTFKLAASLARKHVLDEKRRNREARRRRLAAATQNANKI